ncbi:hypothetical protein DAPPUDRAFT_253500 [Daphnia pulex]|uniref:Uncharacterized protein n=1 Tax=Daphnia pulex TaxID=6669 RepID=E9H4Z6_DAPPU|nr:hypothetical protein DAPPUDRAFT_253500 [Daphnia pulex]|eukprot:EFX73269.1 hypothetical protein DAPPUDRAFT_253500 [Daphnia pulex]
MLDIRQNAQLRKQGEDLISEFDRTFFSKDEKPFDAGGSAIVADSGDNKIVVQEIFIQDGKHWIKLELLLSIFCMLPGPSSSIATVILEAGTEFPVDLIRRAFVISMTECVYVWLNQND